MIDYGRLSFYHDKYLKFMVLSIIIPIIYLDI